MNYVYRHAKAGAETQHSAGILGNVGLVEGEGDGDFSILDWSGLRRNLR